MGLWKSYNQSITGGAWGGATLHGLTWFNHLEMVINMYTHQTYLQYANMELRETQYPPISAPKMNRFLMSQNQFY